MASVLRGSGASTLGGALDVQGVLSYEDVTSVDSIGIVTARSGLHVGTGASIFSPDTNELALGTNNTQRLTVASGGNIGIGTDNPLGKLTVSNGSVGLEFNPNSEHAIVSYNRVTSAYTPVGLQGSVISLRIGGVGERLRIASNGYVGMNLDANISGNATVTPWTNLHVVGSNVADGVSARNNATPTGQLHVSSSGYGINQGGTISLGSEADNVNPNAAYASISGRRVSSLGYQYGGYLTLNVSNGTTLNEAWRINSQGSLIKTSSTSNETIAHNVTTTILTVGSANAIVHFDVIIVDNGYRQGVWAGQYTLFVSDAAGSPAVSYYLKEHWQDVGSSNWNSPVVTVAVDASGNVTLNATNSNSDMDGNAYVYITAITGGNPSITTYS